MVCNPQKLLLQNPFMKFQGITFLSHNIKFLPSIPWVSTLYTSFYINDESKEANYLPFFEFIIL